LEEYLVALDFPANPTDGQIYEQFFWDDTAGIWRNRQIVAKLDNLADVDAPNPEPEDKLIWNGTAWVAEAGNLNGISDVSVPSPQANEKLRWNGTAWVGVLDNLDSIANVSVPSPSVNQKLRWNGTNWVGVEDSLNSLTNVSAASPNNEDTIIYDANDQVWKARRSEPPLATAFLLMGA
jgi:hypothetical protein